MGKSYQRVEKNADRKLKNEKIKKEIEMLEEIIIGLMEDPFKNGLTEMQIFLIKYYGLDEQEVQQDNFDISSIEQMIDIYNKNGIQRDQLETNRYNELIDMYSTMEEFDGKEINKYNDCFHKDIRDWDDYTRDFEQDSLIVKKMRNLQMLNKMANKYEFLLKKILYQRIPQMDRYCINDRKIIKYNIEKMFSQTKSKAENAKRKLIQQLGSEKVSELENNKVIEYCINASRWMFKQKEKYLLEVLQDLQNNAEYNYGVFKGAFRFDVPGYGQFSIQTRENNATELKQFYNVKDYEGDFLGDVYILSKADPELLKDVNYEKLSNLDKQRYNIACKKTKQKNRENLEYEETRESIEQIIIKLKEMKEKINKSISDNQEPTSEVIRDIEEIKKFIKLQKENKEIMKSSTLKQEKLARNNVIDDERKEGQKSPKPLDEKEQEKLFTELNNMKKKGVDTKSKEYQDIRHKLIVHNIRMARWTVSYKYSKSLRKYKIERKDLEQIAMEELIRAVDEYDIGTGKKFSTYAIPRIYRAVVKEWRESKSNLESLEKQWQRLEEFEEENLKNVNRQPTDEEIKKFLGIEDSKEDSKLEKLKKYINYHLEYDDLYKDDEELIISNLLDDERVQEIERNPILNGIYIDEEVEEGMYIEDDTRNVEIVTQIPETNKKLREALDTLTPREKKALELRFGLNDGKPKTLREIRSQIGAYTRRST